MDKVKIRISVATPVSLTGRVAFVSENVMDAAVVVIIGSFVVCSFLVWALLVVTVNVADDVRPSSFGFIKVNGVLSEVSGVLFELSIITVPVLCVMVCTVGGIVVAFITVMFIT